MTMMMLLQPITCWMAAWLYWRVFGKVGLLGAVRLVALLPALVWLATLVPQGYSEIFNPTELVQVTTLSGEVIQAPDPSGTAFRLGIWSAFATIVATWIPLVVLAFAKLPMRQQAAEWPISARFE